MRFYQLFILMLMLFGLTEITEANLLHFNQKYSAFLKAHTKNGRVNYNKILKNKEKLQKLVILLQKMKIKGLSANELKAFWINAYNISAIKTVIQYYPIRSAKQIRGFFTNIKHSIGGMQITLDNIEHKKLLRVYEDGRIHFALVCASQGCPKIISKSYQSTHVEKDLETQTKLALNEPYFVNLNQKRGSLQLSELFRWYKNDFTRNTKNLIAFLNLYRKNKISSGVTIKWKDYDWTLNDTAVVSKRDKYFDSSSLRSKGGLEIKSYNILYTQTRFFNASAQRVLEDKRSTWFTSITGFYYGIHEQWNLGLDFFAKSVRFDTDFGSPVNAFKFETNLPNAHAAFTNIIPKVKFAPIKSLPYLSMQVSLLIPIGSDFEGNTTPQHPFLEHDAWQLWYEIYYDLYIGDSFSFFFAFGLFPRVGWFDSNTKIGIGGYYKTFFQYFLNDIFTFYLVGETFGLIINAGIGTKILIDRAFQLDFGIMHSLIGRNKGVGTSYSFGISYLY